MIQATSEELNIPLRTEIQAKCELLPKRFPGWHGFHVRKVIYHGKFTESYPICEASAGIQADAFGLYGVSPDGPEPYFISDCRTLEDADKLRLAFERGRST